MRTGAHALSASPRVCLTAPNTGLPTGLLHDAWGHTASCISSKLGSHTNTADSVLREGRGTGRDRGQAMRRTPPGRLRLAGRMGAPSERRGQPQSLVPTACLPVLQPSPPSETKHSRLPSLFLWGKVCLGWICPHPWAPLEPELPGLSRYISF